ncbi:MAG TPA: hypothetical protein VGO87_09555 [Acidimicrobiia bacterium]
MTLGKRGRLAVVVVLGAVLGGAAAGAEESPQAFGFQGFTAASSLRLSYEIPGYIAPRPIDGAGPVAEATLDALAGKSFASLPYPGDDGVNYPALVNVATGQTPPGYPFYAAATSDQPESKVSDPSGTYLLAAKVAPQSATSEGKFRPSGGATVMSGGVSTTSVTSTAAEVVATAESVSQGIRIGDLTVGTVRSKSVTVYKAGFQPATTSETLVEGGRVGETSFSFGPKGLSVAQNSVPVPAGEGLAALNKGLGPAGLTVSFADVTELVGGKQTAAFVVRSQHPSPVPGAKEGILTLRFGQALSGVIAGGSSADTPIDAGIGAGTGAATPGPAAGGSSAAPAVESGPGTPASGNGPGGTAGQAPAFRSGFSGDTSGAGKATGSEPAPFSGDTSGVLGGAPFDQTAPGPAAAPPRFAAPVRAGVNVPAKGVSASPLYGVLALAGLMFIAVSSVWRKGGQKWTS